MTIEELTAEIAAAKDALLVAHQLRTGRRAAQRRLRLAQAALLFEQSRWTVTQGELLWIVHRANQNALVSGIFCTTEADARKTAKALNDTEIAANPLKKLA